MATIDPDSQAGPVGAPPHPGRLLLEQYVEPAGMTQTALARQLDISLNRLNELIGGKRGITADTAIRLERVFPPTAEQWMAWQTAWDLWGMRSTLSAVNAAVGQVASQVKILSAQGVTDDKQLPPDYQGPTFERLVAEVNQMRAQVEAFGKLYRVHNRPPSAPQTSAGGEPPPSAALAAPHSKKRRGRRAN